MEIAGFFRQRKLADVVKSILFLDFERIERSLKGTDGGNRLAARAQSWLAAIETGRLIGPEGNRRRLSALHCYMSSAVSEPDRAALIKAGFRTTEAADKTALDLTIAMDATEALLAADGPEEFIFLTTSTSLSPLLARLKAARKKIALLDDVALPEATRAIANALLKKDDFAAFIASEETPEQHNIGGSAGLRAEIEVFARKANAATSIPLLSPKAYTELFRHLTQEIRENGYHFQSTAKNVAERMTTAGRNVTRRQVVFIVKGLALKGHVFSTTDTPEKLAEAFREQARYLIRNAGIPVDAAEERLLQAWFSGTAAEAEVATPAKPSETPAAKPVVAKPAVKVTAAKATFTPAEKATPKPAAATAKEAAKEPPAAAPRIKTSIIAARPAPPSPLKPPPQPVAREESKAVIAARLAASSKQGSGSAVDAAKPVLTAAAPPSLLSADRDADALESSILAAIAQAVDVLVEDGIPSDPITTSEPDDEADVPATADDTQPESKTAESADVDEQPFTSSASDDAQLTDDSSADADDEGQEEDDSDDIGSQIQRIIASYSRNREV